jgi:hypothetical protein
MGIPFCARCGAATRELCKCPWKVYTPLTAAAWREEIAERAAIREYEAGQSRDDANRLAMLEVGPCPTGGSR